MAGETEKHETRVGGRAGTKGVEMSRTKQIQDCGLLNSFPDDIQPKIIEFAVKELAKGRAESGVKTYVRDLSQLLKRGADLHDPQSVAETVAKVPESLWSSGTKENKVISYHCFVKFLGSSWQRPRYKKRRKVPFIPLEKEIDELIAGCSRLISTALQIAKDSAARKGEIGRLKWTDIDVERRIIAINEPEKGSNTRAVSVSRKCIEMLNQLPRKRERIFSDMDSLYKRFIKQRRRLAYKLDNPRLLKIAFHTLRHWKATTEYHKTKDILHVRYILGHRKIENTLIYIQIEKQLFQGVPDEFLTKVAHNIQEACKLLEVGFEYVTTFDNMLLFRKRK